MHTVYYNTMHGDPDKLYVNMPDALERMRSEEKTLLWATAFTILGKHDMYKALQIEDAINTQTAWGIQKDSEYRDDKKIFALGFVSLSHGQRMPGPGRRITQLRGHLFTIPVQ